MLKVTQKAIDIKLIIKNYLCDLHSYDKCGVVFLDKSKKKPITALCNTQEIILVLFKWF